MLHVICYMLHGNCAFFTLTVRSTHTTYMRLIRTSSTPDNLLSVPIQLPGEMQQTLPVVAKL